MSEKHFSKTVLKEQNTINPFWIIGIRKHLDYKWIILMQF